MLIPSKLPKNKATGIRYNKEMFELLKRKFSIETPQELFDLIIDQNISIELEVIDDE
jgi:hypothetical protein